MCENGSDSTLLKTPFWTAEAETSEGCCIEGLFHISEWAVACGAPLPSLHRLAWTTTEQHYIPFVYLGHTISYLFSETHWLFAFTQQAPRDQMCFELTLQLS